MKRLRRSVGAPDLPACSVRWPSLVALRALDGDPLSPWWTIGVLAAISLRNVWIAWREGGRGSMWIAAVLANVAVSTWWIATGSVSPGRATSDSC